MTDRALPDSYEQISEWILLRIPVLLALPNASQLADPEMREIPDVVGGVLANWIVQLVVAVQAGEGWPVTNMFGARSFFQFFRRAEVTECHRVVRVMLEDVLTVLEQMARSPNVKIQNFVQVSVFENMSRLDRLSKRKHRKTVRTLKKFLGPASRKLWDEWAEFYLEPWAR